MPEQHCTGQPHWRRTLQQQDRARHFANFLFYTSIASAVLFRFCIRFALHRKSHTEIGELYFWTATINNWHRLLLNDRYKAVIIDSLNYLSNTNKIDVYAFVIMPNHIHLIWRMNEMNGKETPKTSFLKHTAPRFKKLLLTESNNALAPFVVKEWIKKLFFHDREDPKNGTEKLGEESKVWYAHARLYSFAAVCDANAVGLCSSA